MGGWGLEVFKFGACVGLPIALFWYINHPDVYRKLVGDTYRMRMERTEDQKKVTEFIEEHRAMRMAQQRAEWEAAQRRLAESAEKSQME